MNPEPLRISWDGVVFLLNKQWIPKDVARYFYRNPRLNVTWQPEAHNRMVLDHYDLIDRHRLEDPQ